MQSITRACFLPFFSGKAASLRFSLKFRIDFSSGLTFKRPLF